MALGLLYLFQEKIIYVPALPGIPRDYPCYPDAFGLDYEDIWIEASDGVRLNAWLMWPEHWAMTQRANRPVIVFFQENAGNMAFRLPFLKAITRLLDCSAFILSYRGYGRSQGKPSEAGIQRDTVAAMEHLLTRQDIDPGRMVLMGRSLGGAVAIYAATLYKRQIKGLIVENTFSSLEATAPMHFPILRPLVGPGKPCNWLLRNKWPSDVRVHNLKDLPVLFLSSSADEMLHPRMMHDLYAVHPSEPWHFTSFEGARHMDCYDTHAAQYWPRLREFIELLFPR